MNLQVFSYSSGKYDEKVEYYTYDENSLIADIGGFLGLLLGHSAMSIYDISRIAYQKIVWKMFKGQSGGIS
jgi:hypothetical protein